MSVNMIDLVLAGLYSALMPNNLFFCFLGVLLGTAVGVLPGFGPMAAVSLLLPVTFYLEPATALIMLAGIYYGSQYGGSITSILLNIPGEATSAVTCLDGYPMARQGRAGAALFITTFASFVGGSVGIIMLMGFSPILARVTLLFASPEYFAMMLVGLVIAATLSSGSALKGLTMVAAGLIFGLVGTDGNTGLTRFTFNTLALSDGIGISAVAMGVFGVGEILASIGVKQVFQVDPTKITFRALMPNLDDIRASWKAVLRGSALGALSGTLPGVGPSLSPFLAYSIEQRLASDPGRFGKGAIEGVAAPEAANNAAVQASFIPTLSLGIPGGATMAVMLGAMMIHNIVPGPRFLIDHSDLFWTLVMSFWIGNVILVILNVPLIGMWVRLLSMPYQLLFPAMLTFICIGAFSVSNSTFEVYTVMVFGVLGYVLARYGFPGAPLLLGFILGPMLEQNFRRAMLVSDGDLMVFLSRPVSLCLIVVAIGLIVLSIVRAVRKEPLGGGGGE